MENKCLAGIDIKTGVVEIIASMSDLKFFDEHLANIENSGCYAVIADKELAKEAWGKKIDCPLDIIKAN